MHRGPSRSCSYDGKIAGLYDLEETLGRGHFAVVKLARHVFTGEKVAVKVIDKSKLDDVSRAHLFQEVRCMKLVQHPNVVRLYEVIDTQTKLYLILELGDGGDLYDYIMKHDGGLGEEVAREYFRQIVRAISYCHRLHVVHRDLKPENVVFFERLGMVKLTDFGFSNRFNPGQKLETSCGSLAYSAPEILLGDSYDAPAVDVWSLGVILYMLVCGQAPFQEANDSETLTMIMDCKYTIPVHVSEGCKRLIARMLIREPEKRATLEEIAMDPWLREDANTEPADFLPLVSREHVSEDDHALIIQKMVNGNIATKEDILEALDKNEYNHITATYFLLAERKLRAHRQEQAQQRLRQGQQLQELSPITSGSKPYAKMDKITGMSNTDVSCQQVNQSLLSAARTPGDQNYRSRKCSIVQEEEDEDDMTSCSGREELAPPHGSLNRRGSRSEGKLNLALQERLAESERRKDGSSAGNTATHKMSVPSSGASNSGGGILHVGIRDDTSQRPVTVWASPAKKVLPTTTESSRLQSSAELSTKLTPTYATSSTKWQTGMKQTVPLVKVPLKKPTSLTSRDPISSQTPCPSTTTSFITESSTISIPIHTSSPAMEQPLLPKYKTMPSPTRPLHTVLGSPPLNEIFEEGESVIGDTTRSSQTSRSYVSRQNYEQRRSRFHKTRTASCSSSDASDDDSESRKKRAHKITGDAKPFQQQRRDSHDDSSDSQDPGGSGGAGGGGSRSRESASECNSGTAPESHADSERTSAITSNGNKGSGGGRRQCRRRPGETRLRESQSLNRITEVQEAELSLSLPPHQQAEYVAPLPPSRVRGFGARLFQGWPLSPSCATPSKKSSQQQASLVISDRSPLRSGNFKSEKSTETNEQSVDNFSVSHRIMGGFLDTSCKELDSIPLAKCHGEGKENCCKSATSKNAVGEKQKTNTGKKGRLLSRYFQVHKKLCLPLPGLFGRGRLYKAQSCGSIVRDRVTSSAPASLLVCGEERWCTAAGKVPTGESTRRCSGTAAGNENNKTAIVVGVGDINQNLKNTETHSESLVPLGATCPGIGMCQVHLGNTSQCCSLC
ncbi:SNF-related serine/threonine-protein kinase-like isoform X1 [Schistocerca gregaria]|uniref:SNF-related serine/threonine-protein kinase-like isoform X1 n=1 Tax=Schistocerca gregaria TaxID=7010 RepID=UPI00211EABEF|nr:SNF-related serine/threonine-protein kinase-like isoform X1 [Schistocerca gregaria]XP_049862991.1 SNF-related serine/threonine-protein kinase-like isoform X1 [Schistocerca gregaria]